MKKIIIYIGFLCLIGLSSFGQSNDVYERYNIHRSKFRVIFNKFSWSLSSGYGLTNYKHNLEGFYFFQDANTQNILSNQNTINQTFGGYQKWMSNPEIAPIVTVKDRYVVPYAYLQNPVMNPLLGSKQVLVNADTVGLSMSSLASTVPILASLHFDIKKFRLGLGYQFERHFLYDVKPNVLEDQIHPFTPDFKKTYYNKFFGILGFQFYEFWDYTFVGEVQIGMAKPGKQINSQTIGLGQKFFTNIGVNIEHNLSEYVRVVIRPSIDLKRYIVGIPDGTSLTHTNRAFIVQAGLSINVPEIPLTPIASDHVQLKHVITHPKTGKLTEVRGQRMWKKQNPKIGENHRKLWRYKWRNKGKIDPY